MSSPAWLSNLRLKLGEEQRFLLLAVLIGIFAGLMVVMFHIAIELISWVTLGSPSGPRPAAVLASPLCGAALSSLLVLVAFRAAQGSGVNQTKSAVYINDGHIPFSTVAGKFLACSIAIGSGASLGPEDPALQMGSGVASLLGRTFRMTRANLRLVAPIGAAAGIAAAFNTPITAVLFVIEEVLGSWNASVLGSIVLSAVSATVVVRWFLGNQPLFRVPAFQLSHPSELLVYAAIGVAGGLLAVLFIKAIGPFRRRLGQLPEWTRFIQPAVAGLLTGCIGLFLPQVMGAGYDSIDSALHNQFPWNLLILLGLAKLLATLLCFGSGIPGGMFAPTLFIGAMIGGGLGTLARTWWPFPTSPTSGYVLVGMGTFFAGVFRAPMTSIFMVFEVSASYVIILPVMVANTIAYLISKALQPVPFFDLVASQEGLDLPSHEAQREHPTNRVEAALEACPMPVFPAFEPTSAALLRLDAAHAASGLFCASDGTWHQVDRAQLAAAVAAGEGTRPLDRLPAAGQVPHVYPDTSLDAALGLFGTHRLLPVVGRAAPAHLLGVLTLPAVKRFYGIGD